MSVAQVGASSTQAQQNPTGTDAFGDVNLDEFLGLLIAQLQNQDPMEPMNNQEILQQVSQIREIESNNRLTETLETVLLGQNMSTASSMIGQMIKGLSEEGETVTGRVDRVSVVDGEPKLLVGNQTIKLTNVSQITSETETTQDE